MPLAATSSYPLLDAFWTIVVIFLWVIWFGILITVFIDIFRSHDLSGWAKALWFLFVLIIPLVGVLVYLIVRGDSMHERQMRQVRAEDQAARSYIQQAAASSPASTADQLEKLANLRDRGAITPEELNARRPRSWPEPARNASTPACVSVLACRRLRRIHTARCNGPQLMARSSGCNCVGRFRGNAWQPLVGLSG